MHGSEIIANEKERILLLFDLYCSLLLWVVEYCRESANPENLRGLILEEKHLIALSVDLYVLLSEMIAGAGDNPLVQGTEQYEYRTSDERIRGSMPGRQTDDGSRVWRICLRKNVDAFPLTLFLDEAEKACSRFGFDIKNIFYPDHGTLFNDPVKLERAFKNHTCDPDHFAYEFSFWQQEALGKLKGFLNACSVDEKQFRDGATLAEMPKTERVCFVEENLPTLEPSHWRVGDYLFPIGEVATILHCKAEAVRNWVRRGKGPGGIGWVAGEIVNGCRSFPAREVIPSMREIQQRRQAQECHRRTRSNGLSRQN